ncbi:hypothetical protein [Yoonia sp. 208BN28-4]|uniref:hypothetical protein n=1 Tax=Yoonia sp. 208BN28-4 TaxID=3126505 RepID=UPI0030EC1D0F
MGTRTAFVLAAALSGSAAFAQDTWNPCGLDPAQMAQEVRENIAGSWTVKNGLGMFTIMGDAMPMPPDADAAADFVLKGDELWVTDWAEGSDREYLVRIGGTDGEIAEAFDKLNAFPTISIIPAEDVATVAGCTLADAPHLQLSGTLSMDGTVLQFQADLMVLEENLMTGAMTFLMTGDSPGFLDGVRQITLRR